MSFAHSGASRQDGLILHGCMSPASMQGVVAQEGASLQTVHGCFRHHDIIGKLYGSKVHGWMLGNTRVLSHRTQIVYEADASFIIGALGLEPGMNVVESGTGSGSFSHHILRAIIPNGHLYTFEYHQKRHEEAKKEFKEHGYDGSVTVEHANVCEEGFKSPGMRPCQAVFLDLPNPWEAIPSAKDVLQDNVFSKICTFSPCIEQVQRTCAVLAEEGFTDIWMAEVLLKEYQVSRLGPISSSSPPPELVSYPQVETKGHTSYLTFASIFKTKQQ